MQTHQEYAEAQTDEMLANINADLGTRNLNPRKKCWITDWLRCRLKAVEKELYRRNRR